ncbi:MAG TPA: hypothetical protein VKA46_42940 [Gemmataceae bacterium]|nr:hypothetical protein [Gemmataceae bacterium]
MFEPVSESLRRAAEANIQMQQDLFKRWAGLCPGVAAPLGAGGEKVLAFQKKGAEIVGELIERQCAALAAQVSAGLKVCEEASRLAEVKDPTELRTRAVGVWQQACDGVLQTYEAQLREFPAAVARWTELVTKA